jgi:hypothetical protein
MTEEIRSHKMFLFSQTHFPFHDAGFDFDIQNIKRTGKNIVNFIIMQAIHIRLYLKFDVI